MFLNRMVYFQKCELEIGNIIKRKVRLFNQT